MLDPYQVRLSDDIQNRRGHSATAIPVCPGLVDIVVFGGTKEDYKPDKDIMDFSRMAIITFGRCLHNRIIIIMFYDTVHPTCDIVKLGKDQSLHFTYE